MSTPRPVIIDTDVASDDWMAILYLLRHPDVSVKAITVTGTGEAHSEPGARNSLGLLALACQPDVPVAMGSETTLGVGHTFPDIIRDMVDSIMGIPLPSNPWQPVNQDAVAFLTSFLQRSPQKVVILALGPLTNLAEAFQAVPSLVERVEMLYVMGGAVDVLGNIFEAGGQSHDNVAEWNIYCDPYAAKVVFHSGVPITLVPLDATNQAPTTMDFYRRMEQDRGTPEADFVFQILLKSKEFIPSGRMYFWDPLTAAILTDESLATFEQRTLTVVADQGRQSGRTLETDGGASVRVCTAVDKARFEELFLDVLNGRPS